MIKRWLLTWLLLVCAVPAIAQQVYSYGNPEVRWGTPSVEFCQDINGYVVSQYGANYYRLITSFSFSGSVMICYYSGGDAQYAISPVASCPAGKVLYQNVCQTACQYDANIAAADPNCAPPPECAENQHAVGQDCVPDIPQPDVGSVAPAIGIQIGTSDASGNLSNFTADDATLMSGGTIFYNCGGWECKVVASDFVGGPDGCLYPTGGGAVVCNFVPRYTGNEANIGVSVGAAPIVSGGSNVQAAPVGCPSGYYLDASGICTAPATTGTPSTTTTPGTASTPGATTCPVGYTADANGVCTGQAAATATTGYQVACPTGYTIGDHCCPR